MLTKNLTSPNGLQENTSTSTSNADVAITKTAPTAGTGLISQQWVIHKALWSYSGTPTGRLTVANGSTVVLDLDITASGPGSIDLYHFAAIGANLVVTLYAGGSGVIGKLNLLTKLE